MKLKRSELMRMIQESVTEMLFGKVAKPISFIFHRLEMGPVEVVATEMPHTPATRWQPAEGGEAEIEQVFYRGKEMSLEDVLDVENTVRMQMGEDALTLKTLEQWILDDLASQDTNSEPDGY